MKAVLNNVRISPPKANIVAGIMRGKPVKEALSLLKFMPNKAAKVLYKVIHSAASNAQNNFNQDLDHLYISLLTVNKGQTLKRFVAAARGRAKPNRKRASNIKVELALIARAGKEKAAQVAKAEVTTEEKKDTTSVKKMTKPAVKKVTTKKTPTKKAKVTKAKQ